MLALDGCPLNCVRQTLATVNVIPTWHIEVTSFGYKKSRQEDCTLSTAYKLLQHIQGELLSEPHAGLH